MKQTLAILLFVLLAACKKEEDTGTDQRQQIIEYLNENGHTAIETESGLFYQVEEEGNGRSPKQNSRVHVNYKGWLLDKTVFDESPDNGTIFELANLIPAWREGIPKIGEGGKILLFSPSHLAYGSRATASIPANSVLIFEIRLRAVID